MAAFRNSFCDMYEEAFPWVEDKRKRRDVEKLWLDDLELKGLMEEKGQFYSRKLEGLLNKEEERCLVEVYRQVNRLKKKA